MPSPLQPALFLDRDGVIIENREGYVRSPAEARFLPGAREALTRLAQTNALIVIVTNQSAIGRGLITRAQADLVNEHVLEQIRAGGGRVDGLYLCPHHPADNCRCRKPAPGLLLDAARDLAIDLQASVMAGDAVTDVQAALAAGVEPVFVLSGRETLAGLRAAGFPQVPVFPGLALVADWFTTRTKTPPESGGTKRRSQSPLTKPESSLRGAKRRSNP